MNKIPITIFATLNINMFDKSYLQVDTDKGSFILSNQAEADAFLNKYEVLKGVE